MQREIGADRSQAYPYPAFVLISPIPPSPEEETDVFPTPLEDRNLPFTRSTFSSSSLFDAAWANEKWKHLTQGRQLLECLNTDGARAIGDWISGARALRELKRRSSAGSGAYTIQPGHNTGSARFPSDVLSQAAGGSVHADPVSSIAGSSRGTKHDQSMPSAPEGFWEPEIQPYEDRSALSDSMSSPRKGPTAKTTRNDFSGSETLTVKLVEPGQVTLDLTKTALPIYQFGRGGSRTRMETHTFVVVTTRLRSKFVPNQNIRPVRTVEDSELPAQQASRAEDPQPASSIRTTILAPPSSPLRSHASLPFGATFDQQANPSVSLTPTDEIMALDLSQPGDPSQPPRPLFFNRDGTISRHAPIPQGTDLRGRSLDVNELLETTDWGETPLGPRESWPQSLKTIGKPESAWSHADGRIQSAWLCCTPTNAACGGARISLSSTTLVMLR